MGKTTNFKIRADYSNDAGKLGRHNLSFKTGAMVNRKKQADKNACRKKINKNNFSL